MGITPAARLNIQVIDDTAEVADLIAEFVRRIGHDVSVSYSARDGRRVLTNEKRDIAFVDVNLDKESGFDLLNDFRDKHPATQFIMISGDQSVESPVKAMRMGAAGYLIKPLSIESFNTEFQRVLKERPLHLQRMENLRRLESQLQEQTQDILAEVGTSFNLQKTLINSLCNLAKARDRETGDHLRRMSYYSREVALHLRENPRYSDVIDDAFVNRILLAAPLHDIGKTGIPDAVLLKAGKLNSDEFEIIKKHTAIGKEILEEVVDGFDGDAPEVILMGMDICAFHHERWDGKGYPNGLAGQEIPLCARIVAIADYYDALSSSRIYRVEPFDHVTIAAMIRRESGAHFDPDIVTAFFEAEPQVIELRGAASMDQVQSFAHEPALDRL